MYLIIGIIAGLLIATYSESVRTKVKGAVDFLKEKAGV